MTFRNAPCHCGSGKKYQQCHGAVANRSGVAAQAPDQSGLAAPAANPNRRSVSLLRQQVNRLIAGRQPEQLDQALECLRHWRELQPDAGEPLQRQLEIHLYRGNLAEAENSLTDWAGLNATRPELDYFRGVLAQLQGAIQDALQFYATAIRDQRRNAKLFPLDESALRVAAAIQLVESAAGNYPGSPGKAGPGMFEASRELQELETALLDWERTSSPGQPAELRTVHANAWYNLGCAALAGFTENDRRVDLFRKAVELDPDHLLARFNQAFATNYSVQMDAATIRRTHREAGEWLEQRYDSSKSTLNPENDSDRRLRLAYLSADFRQHSVAHFITPVLQHHDQERFEVFVYHNHRHEDGMTELARQAAGHFENVTRLSDAQLAQRIRHDRIDILVDLSGLSENHRLAVLAQRVAPVQASWIGYPNTTGLRAVDYRLVDALTDPPGPAEGAGTEQLIRLQKPFLAYLAPNCPMEPGPLPCAQNGYVTLGSFNALPKLNPPLLRHWAGIMQQIPGSRLLVKNPGMDFPGPRAQILEVFDQCGIASDRLMFAGSTASQAGHLEYYRRVDISLDTFPYHGTTTTCDSLWMGVPVVSLAGNDHRSRVGLSLLSALGLESLVASDENSHRGIVTALAGNREMLQDLRANLRNTMKQSPLMDAARLTTNLEAELLNAWQRLPANKSRT